MNSYKPVASGGPLFNNIGYILPGGEDAVYEKQQFLNNYKFNLCFENASYPGYATEKLYEALCARTIPIYWGSPTITMDFNHKAFLNWHDYKNDKEFLEAIKRVDTDNSLYMDMFFQPMFAPSNNSIHIEKFLNWFDNMVYNK